MNIRYQIFIKVREGILQKEQVVFRHIVDNMVADTDKTANNILRFACIQSMSQTDKMQTVNHGFAV